MMLMHLEDEILKQTPDTYRNLDMLMQYKLFLTVILYHLSKKTCCYFIWFHELQITYLRDSSVALKKWY